MAKVETNLGGGGEGGSAPVQSADRHTPQTQKACGGTPGLLLAIFGLPPIGGQLETVRLGLEGLYLPFGDPERLAVRVGP